MKYSYVVTSIRLSSPNGWFVKECTKYGVNIEEWFYGKALEQGGTYYLYLVDYY